MDYQDYLKSRNYLQKHAIVNSVPEVHRQPLTSQNIERELFLQQGLKINFGAQENLIKQQLEQLQNVEKSLAEAQNTEIDNNILLEKVLTNHTLTQQEEYLTKQIKETITPNLQKSEAKVMQRARDEGLPNFEAFLKKNPEDPDTLEYQKYYEQFYIFKQQLDGVLAQKAALLQPKPGAVNIGDLTKLKNLPDLQLNTFDGKIVTFKAINPEIVAPYVQNPNDILLSQLKQIFSFPPFTGINKNQVFNYSTGTFINYPPKQNLLLNYYYDTLRNVIISMEPKKFPENNIENYVKLIPAESRPFIINF